MTTLPTMTLTDFLLARIAEDEADWKSSSAKYTVHHPDCDYPGDMPGHCDCNLLSRLLAECEAKRQIIDIAFKHAETIDGEWACCHTAEEIRGGQCEVMDPNEDRLLCALALPYADHPDYREEFRP